MSGDVQQNHGWAIMIPALSGIIGAFLGGALSLGGTYLASQSQSQQADFERRRAAYVDYFSEVNDYRSALLGSRNAANSGNQAEYAKADALARDEGTEAYVSAIGVDLVTENGDAALEAYEFYVENDRGRIAENLDVNVFHKAITEGDKAVNKVRDLARQDLQK